MIDELHVQNVALIREATLVPASGLTVITGETGAGKSALLSAIKLLVGERADAGAVREGERALAVEARFFSSGSDMDGTVVRRRVEASGRGRVEIDGRMASVRELAEGVGSTIDLCGQHEHQRLLRVQNHVALLDAWGEERTSAALAAYRDALASARAAADELERVSKLARTAQERLDDADFTLRTIDQVGPSVEEFADLEATLPRVEHAEQLMRAASAARAGLVGDGGVCDVLAQSIDELEDAARHDERLSRFAEALDSNRIDLEDIASELRSYRDDLDFDPEQLDEMQGRMAAYQGLLRRFGPDLEDVLERRERAAEIVSAASDGGERERACRRAVEEAEQALAVAADALEAARREAAPGFAQAVSAQMAYLKMGTAEVSFSIERLPRAQWGPAGPCRVELMYRPSAGLSPRPLRKIASGGEVSRVMLAVKVVLGEVAKDSGADAETLVFDEVDAGVGGATAVALAEVLARLAKTHQVIVVSHLAQVAVLAESHYLVEKSGTEVSETGIRELAADERAAEIARMLSGDASETSLAHAREMLEAAARQR